MKKSKATEALRVATDVAAIRAVLKKRGYTIRKQPKQAAWTVSVTQDLRRHARYSGKELKPCNT